MTVLSIDINTSDNLGCACCMPAPVILCVDPTKIALEVCSGGGSKLQKSTIPGTLIAKSIALKTSCQTIYRYTVQYDSDSIVAGQTLLPADVRNILCKSCLTNWVEDLVGLPCTLELILGNQDTPPLLVKKLTVPAPGDTAVEAILRFTDQYGCVTDIPIMTPVSSI